MRFTVVSSVRNEGPFLVEWVAWYRRLGFTDIVVVTNDCTDHSPALLDALAPMGVTHLRHDVPDRTNICARKLEAAKALPQVSEADWVLVCDVDEFLVIHRGTGRIDDLIPPNADFLGMAINWRVFGTSGRVAWQDGLTHRQFLSTSESQDFPSTWVKTIHAHPGWFRRLAEHGPKRLLPRRASRWGQPGMRWVNADGEDLPEWQPGGDYLRRVPMNRVSHATAQMNHYMIRSEESFRLKKGTLSSVAGKDRYTDGFFDRYNRNEVPDDSALLHARAFDDVHAAMMALPGVTRLHHLCCADYVAQLAAKAGLRAEDDPRHAHHLALANA
ncbi:glycosyltransferase family 2 protein [Pseudotabrizicola sp.]|uniref:glycosyltransferase family 2 protein n=1 Tax=Pseudotabrizicola sp. TaxID=2939647 RepID=UPI002724032F|nr:glycosyltransferase family 2 protein [Pseudotabrizicola sp.]MDO8884655.1 glycosyltransferase family 2 protein [Pseudotabrizicola sp.]